MAPVSHTLPPIVNHSLPDPLVGTPLLIVWLLGLTLGASLWSRRRGVAALLVAGCLVALVAEFFGLMIAAITPYLIAGRALGVAGIGIVYAVVGVARGLLMAVAWGLTIGAVWRAVREEA